MNNVTISNNAIDRQNLLPIRVRVLDLNNHNGTKVPTSTVIDVPVGSEERINFDARAACLEIRAIPEGDVDSDTVEIDPIAMRTAFDTLKAIITSIPQIRADLTLSDIERDQKAAAAWNAALRLASQ